MTIIEFFSEDPIENVASLIALRPTRVILLCKSCPTEDVQERYTQLVRSLGQQTELMFRVCDPADFDGMCQTLIALLDAYEDVRLDLTGGNETALVAAGCVAERLSPAKTVAMHRFDLKAGTARDIPGGEPLSLKAPLQLTVKQFTELHGDKAAGSASGLAPLRAWEFTPTLCAAVERVWRVSCTYRDAWNSRIGDLNELLTCRVQGEEPSVIAIDRARVTDAAALRNVEELLTRLANEGVVELLGDLRFRYSSDEAKHCLSKEGNALEMYTLLTAMTATCDDGSAVFCDAKNSVYIDWNGQFGERNNTHNEIDVMMMCGVCPVFVSCKNGAVKAEEPFKLRAVTDRFGGDRATAVLIDNNYGLDESLAERAKQMGIRVIRDVNNMSAESFAKRLRKLAHKA